MRTHLKDTAVSVLCSLQALGHLSTCNKDQTSHVSLRDRTWASKRLENAWSKPLECELHWPTHPPRGTTVHSCKEISAPQRSGSTSISFNRGGRLSFAKVNPPLESSEFYPSSGARSGKLCADAARRDATALLIRQPARNPVNPASHMLACSTMSAGLPYPVTLDHSKVHCLAHRTTPLAL